LASLRPLAGLLPLLAVCAVAVAVNYPTFDDYFHGDDYLAFIDLATRPTWQHIEEVLTFKDTNVYWRPLGELYYLIMWETFGLNEVAYHVASVGFFVATLALLYAFCLQAGFGRNVAIGACAFLTLFPNHVVSVAWITNGPRIIAVMLALASLVVLQRAMRKRSLRLEAASFLLFAFAGLADEVTLALAPLAFLYSYAFDPEPVGRVRRTITRGLPYGALLLALAPLQFIATESDPGFDRIELGTHMPEHLWALAAKLVWPARDGISFAQMTPAQWAAGAVALGLAAMALVAGTNRLRFLVIWALLGLAPFTLWLTPIVPARYLYMAAVPFAVIVAWAAVRMVDVLRASAPGALIARNVPVSSVVVAAAGVVLVFLGSVGASMTRERDATFARDTETYRILADGLRDTAPQVPQGARIVIYYGIWNTYYIWPDAVAKTIYRDRDVRIVNVPRGQVDGEGPARKDKDVVLFYTGRGFIRSAPSAAGSQ
jgi:hypothetical protein